MLKARAAQLSIKKKKNRKIRLALGQEVPPTRFLHQWWTLVDIINCSFFKEAHRGFWANHLSIETLLTSTCKMTKGSEISVEENSMMCQPRLGLFFGSVNHFLFYTGPEDVFLFTLPALDHSPLTLKLWVPEVNMGVKTEWISRVKQQ